MKKLAFIGLGFALLVCSCRKDTDMPIDVLQGEPITDIDGNVYPTIQIGDQTWMQENLRTTRYADGTAIDIQSTGYENAWDDEAVCFADSHSTYGLLYNWVAASRGEKNCQTKESFSDVNRQGICPDGWHLPNDREWETLLDYLGGTKVAGAKMKSAGDNDWEQPNLAATNESLFSALPSGQFMNGFDSLGYYAYFWTATQHGAYTGGSVYLGYYWAGVDRSSAGKTAGLACRCVKD